MQILRIFKNGSFAFFQTLNNAAIITPAKPEQRGVISRLLNLARTLGQTTDASLMGAFLAYFTTQHRVYFTLEMNNILPDRLLLQQSHPVFTVRLSLQLQQ